MHKTLEIHTSPHIASGASTDVIMRNVVYALLPVGFFAIYAFGIAALFSLATATASAVLTEHLLNRWNGRETPVGDWSAAITGLIYGLTLPPALPLWMVAFGAIIAIALGKFLFGGLGFNSFNPALVGRAFLQAAFPVAITTWHPAFSDGRFSSLPESALALPFTQPVYDAVTGATPLAAMKFEQQPTAASDLIMGMTTGSSGETCAMIILLGGLYLAARNMLNWRIPAAIFVTVFLMSAIFYTLDPQNYPSPIFMLFSGGLMFGAVFMATDMVASPLTTAGVIIYGVIIGLLVVVIRLWGGLPEGVMYAILFANAASPHIDNLIQPRIYGARKPEPLEASK